MVFNSESPNDLARQAILKTLAYSDIFDFPLTKEEIWKFLISGKKINYSLFKNSLQKLVDINISRMDNYYCLIDNKKILNKRKKNLSEIEKKQEIAQKVIYQISNIPTILFIGISGGLAMDDVEEKDDIDLFVITKKDKIYITRFWVFIVLEILKVRRKRNEKNSTNKICVNFFMDENSMNFKENRHDIYTAHEIAQLKPIFERDRTYSKFLIKNSWVKKYLVNLEDIDKNIKFSDFEKYNLLKSIFWIFTKIPLSEFIARLLQTYYMRNHKNTEIVTNSILGFHPVDYRVQTLKKLRLKYQQLGLLTNT